MILDTPSGVSPFAAATATADVLLPRPVRVLLIEDDADWRGLLTDILGAEGFEVEGVENGLVALLRLQATHALPEVVLLDLEMPVMDGRAFLALARRDPALRAVPMVVLSSSARDGVEVAASLDKSCDPDALIETLRAVTGEAAAVR